MTAPTPIHEQILERAIQVIEENGEAGIRTHGIATDCGVTAPVLYRIFGDREGLIVAAQLERYKRTFSLDELGIGAEIRRRVALCLTRQDLVEALRWFYGVALQPERRRAVFTRIEVLGSAMTRKQLMDAVAVIDRENIRDVNRVFAAAIEHGWIKPTFKPESILSVWQGVVLGSYIPAVADDLIDLKDWSAAITEAMLHLMFDDLVER